MPTNKQKNMQSAREEMRRFLFRVLGAGLMGGVALWYFSPRNSSLATAGLVLALICFVPVAYSFGPFLFLPQKRGGLSGWQTPLSPQAEFAQGIPVPELLVAMRLLEPARGGRGLPMRSGRHTFALVLGTEGYTVRFDLPEGGVLDAEHEQLVAVQFLRPELALQHFVAGTQFRMLTSQGVIGEGKVIEILQSPEVKQV